MDERVVTRIVLEELLREAEHAHADYERGLGHGDADWPAWYARYIVERLPPLPHPGEGSGIQSQA